MQTLHQLDAIKGKHNTIMTFFACILSVIIFEEMQCKKLDTWMKKFEKLNFGVVLLQTYDVTIPHCSIEKSANGGYKYSP